MRKTGSQDQFLPCLCVHAKSASSRCQSEFENVIGQTLSSFWSFLAQIWSQIATKWPGAFLNAHEKILLSGMFDVGSLSFQRRFVSGLIALVFACWSKAIVARDWNGALIRGKIAFGFAVAGIVVTITALLLFVLIFYTRDIWAIWITPTQIPSVCAKRVSRCNKCQTCVNHTMQVCNEVRWGVYIKRNPIHLQRATQGSVIGNGLWKIPIMWFRNQQCTLFSSLQKGQRTEVWEHWTHTSVPKCSMFKTMHRVTNVELEARILCGLAAVPAVRFVESHEDSHPGAPRLAIWQQGFGPHGPVSECNDSGRTRQWYIFLYYFSVAHVCSQNDTNGTQSALYSYKIFSCERTLCIHFSTWMACRGWFRENNVVRQVHVHMQVQGKDEQVDASVRGPQQRNYFATSIGQIEVKLVATVVYAQMSWKSFCPSLLLKRCRFSLSDEALHDRSCLSHHNPAHFRSVLCPGRREPHTSLGLQCTKPPKSW